MLSEEEKKAIEYLKYMNNRLDFNKIGYVYAKKYIDTVLNLITRLKKENEYWKNGFERELQDNRKNTCELLKQDLIIREKDKQIDLMAEHIVSSAIVDDTVCAIKCDCESDISEDCSHEKMLNCTKEYFERKATNIG